MFSYSLFIPIKQSGHLISRKPYSFVLQFHFNGCLSINGLVYNNFVIQFHTLTP